MWQGGDLVAMGGGVTAMSQCNNATMGTFLPLYTCTWLSHPNEIIPPLALPVSTLVEKQHKSKWAFCSIPASQPASQGSLDRVAN